MTATPNLGLVKPAFGDAGWEDDTNDNWDKLDFFAGSLGKNDRAINGNILVDQRHAGASFVYTNNGQYGPDRFFCGSAGLTTQTVSAQQVTSTLTKYAKSLKITVGTGGAPASNASNLITYIVEGTDWGDMKWGTADASAISVRFTVKSSVTGTYGFAIRNGAVTRSQILSYNLVANVESEILLENIAGCTDEVWTPNATDGVQFTWDLGVGSNASNTVVGWINGNYMGLTGGTKLITSGAATFELSGFHVNKGAKCTNPEFKPYSQVFADCLRYYQKITGFSALCGADTVSCSASINFPTMRTVPVPSQKQLFAFWTAAANDIVQTSFSLSVRSGKITPSMAQLIMGNLSVANPQGSMMISNTNSEIYLDAEF